MLTVAYDENEMFSRIPVSVGFNPSAQIGQLINLIHNGGILGGSPLDDAIARQAARDANEIETDLLGKDEVENRFVANTTEFELSDTLTLKNVFGYRDMEFGTASDADGTALSIAGP